MEKVKKQKYYSITLCTVISVICAIVFYYEYKRFAGGLLAGTVPASQMLTFGGDQGSLTWGAGQFWRAISGMFLHANPTHIISNLISLMAVGPILETRAGKLRFLLIYFLSGICGSFVNFVSNPNTVTVGASGAIYGILGALLVLTFLRNKTFTPKAFYWVLFITASNLFYSFTSPQVATASHIGGLVTGIILMLLFLFTDRLMKLKHMNQNYRRFDEHVRVQREKSSEQ